MSLHTALSHCSKSTSELTELPFTSRSRQSQLSDALNAAFHDGNLVPLLGEQAKASGEVPFQPFSVSRVFPFFSSIALADLSFPFLSPRAQLLSRILLPSSRPHFSPCDLPLLSPPRISPPSFVTCSPACFNVRTRLSSSLGCTSSARRSTRELRVSCLFLFLAGPQAYHLHQPQTSPSSSSTTCLPSGLPTLPISPSPRRHGKLLYELGLGYVFDLSCPSLW